MLVAIAVENYFVAGPDLALALVRAVAAVPGWEPLLIRGAGADRQRLVARIRGSDAVILTPDPGGLAAVARGRQVVTLFGDRTDLPAVQLDQPAFGRVAAEHLVTGGCRSLVWSSAHRGGIADQRRSGVVAIARSHGLPLGEAIGDGDHLVRLRRLPQPVGVVAYNDIRGAEAVGWCRRGGLEVPRQVQIIGIDDDELACHACRPALSSVGLPWPAVAAAAVAQLRRPGPPIVVPPGGVVVRGSTAEQEPSDALVAAACRLMRSAPRLNAGEVAARLGLSRSRFERRFRAERQRSPLTEIQLVRAARAQALLAAARPVAEVALDAGYPSAGTMARALRRLTGRTPRDLRP